MARAPKTPAAKKLAPKKPTRPAARKPARPKGLAHRRWLGDFPNLSAAEKRLVECCARGVVWRPEGWDGERPEAATAANTIRAELIRFLALGGDDAHPVHDEGVMARGAWVAGTLDLHQCQAKVRLDLRRCHFAAAPILNGARLPGLVLSGCKQPGLRADGIQVANDVYLDEDFSATGEVRLLGAEIGGDLSCIKGTFTNAGGDAISADRIKVAGGIFLRGGFAATGEVRLLGAEIGGNIECNMGTFTNAEGNALSGDRTKVTGGVFLGEGFAAKGEVRFLGAEIGGFLDCTKGTFTNANQRALNVESIKVTGGMFLRKAKIEGAVNLADARIGTLVDDESCWAAGGHFLDGLHYDRIAGRTDAETRIRWLERQNASQLDGRDWAPQPWEQLIKTLRDMGHPLEATKVAIAKQERMRRAGKVGGPLAQVLHRLYGLLAGYGYRPLNTVQWMLAVFLACAFFFHIGAGYGYMGPTTPLLNSPEIAAQVNAECGHRFELEKERWIKCSAMPPEYTTFQPLVYSLDLILPLVDLQQEADWAPIVEAPERPLPFGAFLRWLMWFEILFGWAMSLMLVAVLGKLVNKD